MVIAVFLVTGLLVSSQKFSISLIGSIGFVSGFCRFFVLKIFKLKMQYLIRKYGDILDVTTYEKKINPKKICLLHKKRPDVVGERRVDSLKRTKQICLRRVLSAIKENGSPLLFTLTFSGSASDAYYANQALSRFQRWLHIEHPGSSSLFVPELSPKGRIHFHGLLFGVSADWGTRYEGRGKSRRIVHVGRERLERHFAGGWGEGFVDVVQTDGSPKLGFYISKYITKAGSEVMFNAMRLLRFSRNFAREFVTRDSYIAEHLISHALDTRDLISEFSVNSVFLGKITKLKYLSKVL